MPEKMNLPSLLHNCLVKVRNGDLHSEGSKFQKLPSFITKCFLKPNQTVKENIKKSLCQFPLSRSIMGISKQFGISNLLDLTLHMEEFMAIGYSKISKMGDNLRNSYLRKVTQNDHVFKNLENIDAD